jgi:predicted nucleic acid-binding protein
VTSPAGLTLDTGALIGLERRDGRVRALLERALTAGLDFAVPAGVVAQAWRSGTGPQVPLARLLADPAVETVALDGLTARIVGVLCGRSGHPDVVDASVVVCARERGHHVVTSDPGDLRKIDPGVSLVTV